MLLLERLSQLAQRFVRFPYEIWVSWRDMLGWGDGEKLEERVSVVMGRGVWGSAVQGRW